MAVSTPPAERLGKTMMSSGLRTRTRGAPELSIAPRGFEEGRDAAPAARQLRESGDLLDLVEVTGRARRTVERYRPNSACSSTSSDGGQSTPRRCTFAASHRVTLRA